MQYWQSDTFVRVFKLCFLVKMPYANVWIYLNCKDWLERIPSRCMFPEIVLLAHNISASCDYGVDEMIHFLFMICICLFVCLVMWVGCGSVISNLLGWKLLGTVVNVFLSLQNFNVIRRHRLQFLSVFNKWDLTTPWHGPLAPKFS